MGRHHPGENLARVGLQNTDAIDPTPIELDHIANIGVPHVMPILGPISEMRPSTWSRLLLSCTAPGTRCTVEFSIDGHGPSPRALTWRWLLALTLEQAMEAPATHSWILMLEVQHLFEKRQTELVAGMIGRPTAVVFEPLKPLPFKGIQNAIHVGARRSEERRVGKECGARAAITRT